MLKRSIRQEDSLVNVNEHNARVPGYLKQLLMGLKGDITPIQ